MIDTQAIGKGRRLRQTASVFAALPSLSPPQRALLLRWLAADAQERRWESLAKLAGADALDAAEHLLRLLLEAGVVSVKESFRNGHWWPTQVLWRDLPRAQQALGLTPAHERADQRQALLAQLRALGEQQAWALPAVQSCADIALPLLASRAALLTALASWQAEQRFGMRQDFALHARGHTKAISAAEWTWLETRLPLESLGIDRFEPLLWLAGALGLQNDTFCVDARACGFLGLPSKRFGDPLRVTRAPRRYWLVENRASFERLSRQLDADSCLIWLPGRPSGDWLAAVGWLLDQAPAPADISCDPDPAGIDIALSAGALWTQRRLPWRGHGMTPGHWQHGQTLPLSDYDRQLLIALGQRADLPPDLTELRDFLQREGRKAEQEGWL